jgi:hypothetical protein
VDGVSHGERRISTEKFAYLHHVVARYRQEVCKQCRHVASELQTIISPPAPGEHV